MKDNIEYWVEQMLKKHGWYAHYVFDDKEYPYSTNIHTHGIETKYNHLDLQICFNLSKELAYTILSYIAGQIRNGNRFTPGIKYPNILPGFDVEFAEAKDGDRIVLRMILPDKYGNVRGELKDQWKGCRIYCSSN